MPATETKTDTAKTEAKADTKQSAKISDLHKDRLAQVRAEEKLAEKAAKLGAQPLLERLLPGGERNEQRFRDFGNGLYIDRELLAPDAIVVLSDGDETYIIPKPRAEVAPGNVVREPVTDALRSQRIGVQQNPPA